MCGRYYVDEETSKDIQRIVKNIGQKLKIHTAGDIMPSSKATVLCKSPALFGAEDMYWGFENYQKKGLVINARAESALDRVMFRDSVKTRRCIIPARGFYEWNRAKEKVTFFVPDHSLLLMAGIYRRYENGNHFVILTTQANESMAPVHDRMPLVLKLEEAEEWVYEDNLVEYFLKKSPPLLDRSQDFEQLQFNL